MSKSYYDAKTLERLLQKWRSDRNCPAWLIEAVQKIAVRIEMIPVEEEKEWRNQGYIYPH